MIIDCVKVSQELARRNIQVERVSPNQWGLVVFTVVRNNVEVRVEAGKCQPYVISYRPLVELPEGAAYNAMAMVQFSFNKVMEVLR